MPFNFSSSEYFSPHKRRKNRVSPVSRASPAHVNSLLVIIYYIVVGAVYIEVRAYVLWLVSFLANCWSYTIGLFSCKS